ncbi:DUF1254 domain-containing protein [Nonomuraea phyllanthi]|uniref:DUF1254 domain-containing protein n=2 Tax=Nonomuraea phyllanthi TaxID=2219224 RepID=A0A5C4WKD5_9ACTN|nr:DUF1254 domain-containing protein [Nonomuraea phyllanthi]
MGGGTMDPTSVRHRAVQAYIYGYPLVLMEISKKTMTNVEKPDPLTFRAPINQFGKGDGIPGPEFRGVVSPNVDTLYTSAWLDVAEEPVVLHVPDTHGRYYLMPMLDGWTNVFASPGKRTTGTGEGDFAITGPNWRGSLPGGVRQLRSPTDTVWILGRTQLNGPSDLPAVHELVARYTLRPLSGYGEGTHTPPPGKADPTLSAASPPAQVEQMDARTFFSHLATAMRANPPAPADAPMVATLAGLGIRPGRPFDADTLGETTAEALDQAPAEAQKQIKAGVAALGEDVNGWRYAADLGSYGTDYLRRAATAWQGLGANLPQDAIYPLTFVDGGKRQLNGAHQYAIHFAPGRTPPASAFWSITIYDAQGFLIENPIDRYEIGHTTTPVANADGSVDLSIQHDPPAGGQANWLPAPIGDFTLMLRMYWPQQGAIDGTWKPPAVTRVS